MNAIPHTSTNAQATPVRLFFDQTPQEYFLVMAEVLSASAPGLPGEFSVHTFEHEDRFLERVGAADLPVSDLALLAATVIRSVDGVTQTLNWVELNLSEEQITALGLRPEILNKEIRLPPPELDPILQTSAFEFTDNSGQFYQFLMQSPTPFVMMSGPEHRFTFINQPYVDLIGGITRADIFMKTVREALPELEGQPFLAWLDEVYATGIPRTCEAQLAHIRRKDGQGIEERYFDFIYYPVRSVTGHIYGVMAQAADVTERVHIQAMSEGRETLIFRQWVELEVIYNTAPIGLALLEVKTLRLLRLNKKHAEMMGASVDELLGKNCLDLKALPGSLATLCTRLQKGETVHNAIIEEQRDKAPLSGRRAWLVNVSPLLGSSGEVVAYTSIALEIPD
jgi:PAS domain-containing protein